MSQRVRRKKRSKASRLRPFWFLVACLCIAAAFGAYSAATWPGFRPQRVSVTGNRVVPTAEILARAHISATSNVWLTRMGAAAGRVDAIPFIASARIHRSLPANVTIAVTERVPYARVRTARGTVVVDRDLRVLRQARPGDVYPVFDLPSLRLPPAGGFIKDPRLGRLRADYDTLAASHVIVAALRYDRFGDLVASMRGGVQLLLGDDTELQRKSGLIAPILSQVAAGGRRIAAVDLRAGDTPVVVYK